VDLHRANRQEHRQENKQTSLTGERWLFGSEVLQRAIITLAVVCMARFGSFAIAPGFDSQALMYTSYSDYGALIVSILVTCCPASLVS